MRFALVILLDEVVMAISLYKSLSCYEKQNKSYKTVKNQRI